MTKKQIDNVATIQKSALIAYSESNDKSDQSI